eukprot:323355_1
MSIILLAVLFVSTFAQKTNNCSVSFNKQSSRKSDPRLIGYNDVLGPIIDLKYSDTALLLSAEKIYPGILRHPGGTVANYWNFSNASYVKPCKNASAGNYNYCTQEAKIDKLPKQTFSAKNFHSGIGTKSPLSITNAHSIVYDLNILTLYGQELLNQLNVLNNELGAANVKYLELGNEYYISKDYSWVFPNSQDYTKKITPLINEIRSKNPSAKIGIVSARAMPGQNNAWNNGIKAFKSSNYDAVTVHDYSASGNSMSESEQLTYISVYGMSVIPQYVQYVHETFGSGKKIWMTEYNWNSFGSTTPFNGKYVYSVLHAMFLTSYIAASVCDTSHTMELLMMHMYSTQDGSGWGGGNNSAVFFAANENDNNGARFTVAGQILAEISYISMVKNNQMFCLDVAETGNNNQECPMANVNSLKGNLRCLFGTGFNNGGNSFGFYIVNACHEEISAGLELSTMINSGHGAITLSVNVYQYSQNGGTSSKFTSCKSNIWNSDCAAVKPQQKQINIASNQNSVTLNIAPMSIVIAVTA